MMVTIFLKQNYDNLKKKQWLTSQPGGGIVKGKHIIEALAKIFLIRT